MAKKVPQDIAFRLAQKAKEADKKIKAAEKKAQEAEKKAKDADRKIKAAEKKAKEAQKKAEEAAEKSEEVAEVLDDDFDDIERIGIDSAKRVFNCNFANIQSTSGTNSNMGALKALTKPGGKVYSV